MPETEPAGLKDKLKKMRVPVADINKFLAYITGEKRTEQRKDTDKRPVTNNTDDMLYTMFVKFWHLGLVIDGVNVVITGRNMAMVTYNGYKNKVKQSYPSATFDIQLVRGEDKFTAAKESGSLIYSHEIANPFENDEIKGAYCIIKIDGVDYFEALNQRDYQEMKKGSKQGYLWDKWESEFWLKSVIKRACKRHFYDEVADLDKVDNNDYGQKDVGASDSKKAAILEVHRGNPTPGY